MRPASTFWIIQLSNSRVLFRKNCSFLLHYVLTERTYYQVCNELALFYYMPFGRTLLMGINNYKVLF